jgi:glycosyltransferase involved in cell wall biosynthesis
MNPLTVVVPTRDRPEFLTRCLAALRASLRPEDELIVVDSASSAPFEGSLRVPVAGASRARNAGWRAATHPIVAFVDDDVRVAPGWAAALDQCFAEHPEAAFVSGRLGLEPGVVHDRPVAFLDNDSPSILDLSTRSGDLGHSANLAVRTSALSLVGGFDELLGAGARYRAAEDLDLIDRMLIAGLVGWYSPSVVAWHDQWRTRPELVRLDYAYGLGGGVRIAKLFRSLPRRARHELSIALWEYGLAEVPGNARRGYKFLTLTPLARVAGTVVGVARGSVARVGPNGHLR